MPPSRSLRVPITAATALTLAASILTVLPVGPSAASEDAEFLGKTHYTGEFHAHTEVSDGVELPKDAFEHVAANSDADFFTVSEHDVLYDRRNSDDFTTDWHDAVSEEWRYLHEESDSFNASQDDLVTLPAEEITWYDDSGHMNLFNTDWMTTARAEGDSLSFGAATGDLKYDLPTFYARLKQDPDAIAQFNHPNPDGKGSFFGFRHLDPEVDERVELIEARDDTQRKQFQIALDAGWHVAPVWNGDEHSATWVTGDDAITGIWAAEKSREGVYRAMQDRSMYSTEDVNAVLEFGADDQLMGSILPADTDKVSLDIGLSDADADESFASVQVVTNDGDVAYEVPGVSGREVAATHELPAEAGDFFYVRATQADGDVIVSAPIWVGETTRGANYAPTIDLDSDVQSEAAYGERIDLPEVTATDDSGGTPQVTYEVWDDSGKVEVADGGFSIRSYSDHVIVVKATDGSGSVGAEMVRIQVSQDDTDPTGVYGYLGSVATVGSGPGTAGLSITTDATVDRAYAQVRPANGGSWRSAPVLDSTDDTTSEINTIGKPGGVYQDTVTGQPVRSHEFDLTGLRDGRKYEYRFGAAVNGSAPGSRDHAWTGVRGSFVAGGKRNRPIYLLGDLAADSRKQADVGLLRRTLDTLRRKARGGTTLVQTGDLVASGVHREYWEDAFDHVYDGLDLQVAPTVGDGESDFDREYNILSPQRNSIFSGMYALPDDGPIGESNYSFDRGDIHVSVLNTVYDLDTQLDWLVDDVRKSDGKWNVVVGHRPYFGGEGAEGPGMKQTRDKISRLFTRLGIDLYVGGHDKVYKRSTIYDGRRARTPEEVAAGTAFVTLGSAGPHFGEAVSQPWDDVVVDEDLQLGTVLEASGSKLSLETYARDGRLVDRTAVARPRGSWKVSGAEIADGELAGVGLLSHRGSRRRMAVDAVSYDASGQHVIDRRLVEVELDQRGAEQWVEFDTPLEVAANDTVKLHFWDGPKRRRELRSPMVLRKGLSGDGSAESPYLVDSADQLGNVAYNPAAHYRVTADLDATDERIEQIGADEPFTGDLDGDGHAIIGLTTTDGGLIDVNEGAVHDLALERASVETAADNVGLLVDTNRGTVERVATSGTIHGGSTVGGVVGYSYGELRDSYSTADVYATGGRQAGGVAGITGRGSLTEFTYATGHVEVVDDANAGGISGYAYTGTSVRHNLALNSAVVGTGYAHRVVARVLAGETATLVDNAASEEVEAAQQNVPETGPDTLNGQTRTAAETADPQTYKAMGWDLAKTWTFDSGLGRPVLRGVEAQKAGHGMDGP